MHTSLISSFPTTISGPLHQKTTCPKDSFLPSLPWDLVFSSPELYYEYEAFKLPGLTQSLANHPIELIREKLQEHRDEASAEQEKENENIGVDLSSKDATQPPSFPELVPTVPN
ncbi:hypothetical protein CVT24_002713 [Panaeolus cyanescens]|uniref:Uncharacterized protein n=1 Tax=Panaeolus cyanescens TaxID=181874 RepID=A0A409WQ33_9AGAR|nr:hypothetical protein CVT24_002713 [Panaeolus cyanescens]